MAHQLLERRWRHAPHRKLEAEVVAKTVDQGIVGKVGRSGMGETLDEVIQRVGRKLTTVVANEQWVATASSHAPLVALSQVFVQPVHRVSSKGHFSSPTRLGASLNVEHRAVGAADIADAECDALAVSSSGGRKQIDDCLIACWPR